LKRFDSNANGRFCLVHSRSYDSFEQNGGRPRSSSRSSKIIDLGANRKPMCNFLLVVSNFGRISYSAYILWEMGYILGLYIYS